MSVRHPALLALICGLWACSSTGADAPSFDVSPGSLSFGTVVAGSGAAQAVTVRNTGSATVRIEAVQVGAGLSVEPGSLEVPAGATRQVTVIVTAAEGMLASRFSLRAGKTSREVHVSAVVVASAISAPGVLGFPDVGVGTAHSAKVPVTNLLDEAVQVRAVIPDTGEASFSTTATGPVEIEPRGVVDIEVLFAPACVGEIAATLVLSTCPGCAETSVTLTGKATGQALSVVPQLLEFGNVAPGGRRLKELTVENHGCSPASLDAVDAGTAPFAATLDLPAALATGAPVKVPIAFTPPARGPYSGELVLYSGERSQKVLVRGQGGGPEISVTPLELDVGVRTARGDVIAQGQVTLSHAGDPGKLLISTIEVVSGPFAIVTDRKLPADLAPGPIVATVTLEASTVGTHEGALRIVAEDGSQPEILVPLIGRVVDGAACQVQVTPSPLRFGLTSELDVRTREVRVRNIGLETCQAWGFAIEGGKYFSVVDAPPVASIDPGKEHVLRLQYAPESSSGVVEASKLVYRLMGASAPGEVPLTALATPYDVGADPPALDLGTGPVGAQRIGAVALTNRSSGRLIVSEVLLENVPSLRVAATLPLPHSLLDGQVLPAFVSTDPVREGLVRGELEFRFRGADEPLIVPVTAVAGPGPCGDACTTPIAACPAEQEALVGEDVSVLGVGRMGDGRDAQCTWSIAGAPAGSTATLEAGSACGAGLRPDRPGEYTLRLTAGADGKESTCEARVRAVSYAGLRVVIDWSAPEDIDLHMVHPSIGGDLTRASSWFINPWDCWFENPHPIWDGGGREDDPKLVRDDQVGTGPEEIRIDVPSSEHVYNVGAHWFAVKNSSPQVDVTARIYCGDEVAATTTLTLGQRFDAGFLGSITWTGPGACTFEEKGTVIRAAPP